MLSPLVEGHSVPKKRELSPRRSEVELSVPWVVDGQHRLCGHDGEAVETFIQERSLVHREYIRQVERTKRWVGGRVRLEGPETARSDRGNAGVADRGGA
jgi:hypothetical protein